MFVVTMHLRGAKRFYSLAKPGMPEGKWLPEWTPDEKAAQKFKTAALAIGVVNEFGGTIEPYPPPTATKVESEP